MRHRHWIQVCVLIVLGAGTIAHAQTNPRQTSLDSGDPMFVKSPSGQPAAGESGSAFVRFFRDAEWYFSWGYSKQYWAPSDIHVSQPSQSSNFTIHNVRGTDDPAWSSLFGGEPLVAQYNVRIGRFINDTVAVEVAFDHSKYATVAGQWAYVTGTIGGAPVNGGYQIDDNFFRYLLHNGVNHLMLNLVYRHPLIGKTNETLSLAFIAKAGAGIVLPHAENTILGQNNDVGPKTFANAIGIDSGWWRLNGWTSGVEIGLRLVVFKPVYLELTNKTAYAGLSNIPVFQGTASHGLWMNETILSLGFTYDGTPRR